MSLFLRKRLAELTKRDPVVAIVGVDHVFMLMTRGLRPDGSAGVPKTVRKRHYDFTPHQSTGERVRRMRQAAAEHLTSEQFLNEAHRLTAVRAYRTLFQ